MLREADSSHFKFLTRENYAVNLLFILLDEFYSSWHLDLLLFLQHILAIFLTMVAELSEYSVCFLNSVNAVLASSAVWRTFRKQFWKAKSTNG